MLPTSNTSCWANLARSKEAASVSTVTKIEGRRGIRPFVARKRPHNVLLDKINPRSCLDQCSPCRRKLHKRRNATINQWSDHTNKFYRFHLRTIIGNWWQISRLRRPPVFWLQRKFRSFELNTSLSLRLALPLLKQALQGSFLPDSTYRYCEILRTNAVNRQTISNKNTETARSIHGIK